MEIERLFDVLFFQAEKYPLDEAVSERTPAGWVHISSKDLVSEVNQLSSGLIKFGVRPQDKVAIASYNCTAWTVADYAISQIGAINVPLYPNSSIEDYAYILRHSDAKVVFCGDDMIYDRIKSAVAGMEFPPKVVCFNNDNTDRSWKSLFEDYEEYESVIDKRRKAIRSHDLATIIYTSGTTGKPKGVMLSHRNIISNCESLHKTYPVFEWKQRSVSFLPLCHIFERTAMYYYMMRGVSIYFINDLDNLGEYIREVKPHYFNAVPRMLEKVYERIVSVGNGLTGIKKKLFFWALDIAHSYRPFTPMSMAQKLQHRIADKLIFSKWRTAVGGNIRHIVSGAAALQPRFVNIFWAAGIPVLEAYGLTETSPGVCISAPRKGEVVAGCVGKPIYGVEVKFDDDGELMVRGENVMMGYFKDKEATDQVMENDWFRTGDIGTFTDSGLVMITDRKKEIFKTSGGKYIAPQKIENLMKSSPLIEQIMVVGEGEKFPGAIVVPQMDQVTHITDHADLEKLIFTEIEKYNESLSQFERIKKIRIVRETWDVDSGLLTPTMKMKRKQITERYQDLISSLYHEPS